MAGGVEAKAEKITQANTMIQPSRQKPGHNKEVSTPTQPNSKKQRNRRPKPGPLFFHTHQRPKRHRLKNLWPAGHQSDSNSHGDQLSNLRRQSAENCEGAKPTFDPALRPAADTLPAVSRGGPPSRRHHTNATLSTTTSKSPCTIFLYRL